MSSQQQVIAELLTFPLGEYTLGVAVPHIEQVMLIRDNVVKLPRTPNFILGALLDEERLIPLLDLEAFLNLRQSQVRFDTSSNAILVTTEQFVYGIFSGVLPQKQIDIPVNPSEKVPEPIPKTWIKSVLDNNGQTIYLVDPNQLWQSLQQG